MRWDQSIKRWRLSTNRGDDIRARFVVMAQGAYNKPKLPGIPWDQGIPGRRRACLPLPRWDYEYTGGDANGGLQKLADKSGSRWSAPARPVSSWYRTWAGMPSSSSCSSAHRPRWTCAPHAHRSGLGGGAAARLAGRTQA